MRNGWEGFILRYGQTDLLCPGPDLVLQRPAFSRENAQDVRELTSGVSIERALASGSSDTFRLALTTGDFVHLTIVQRGFAVESDLVSP